MDLPTGSNDTDEPDPAAASRPAPTATSRLDAASLFYEIGREVQAVALVMRKHEIVCAQQICACGRLPVHMLPFFGLRCDVARQRFAVAEAGMRRVMAQSTAPGAVGRVRVNPATPRQPPPRSGAAVRREA